MRAALPGAPAATTTNPARHSSPPARTPVTRPPSNMGRASAFQKIRAPAAAAASTRAASKRRRGHTAPCAGKRSVSGQGNTRSVRPAIIRNPRMGWEPSIPIPRSRKAPTARGVRPSPHALSRPYPARSNMTVSAPRRAAVMAAAAPAGPAPMTAMSQTFTG